DKHAGRRRIVAEGSAADVNAAFAVTLNKYRAPERTVPRRRHHGDKRPFAEHMLIGEHTHRGFAGPAHLPAKLIGIVTAIIGLDDRRLGTPAGAGAGDPPGAGYLSPATIAQAYNFPTNTAVGQTIGLFEAADAGAAYLPTDIQSFILSLPGGLLLPNLTDVLLLGNINNPTNVTAPPNPGVAGAVFECTIDVSIAAAAASGVNINVYFTNGTEAGWEAFFSRAIFPLPGDNPPSVLSASWVPYLSDDSGTVGLLANPASPVSIFTGYLQSAAARGITVLMALGDWGANNLVFDTVCHVSYPNCDPWVTACGGTILGAANSSPPPLLDEWTWSDANVASQFDLAPYDATGGGVSDTFARPPYQVAAGILPVSKNDGNVRRGVPDVAGMVAMSGFFIAGVGGPGQNGGVGTSAVAPLYAGLIATVNAFLGRAVGFLNPSLYAFGPQICNDIRIGNNDSGNLPDSPFYAAAVGWDTCTGWGSIDGLRLLPALAPAPIVATAIADTGAFGNACVGSFVDEVLTIDNSGFATLLIWSITSSSPAFEVPIVSSYPLAVAPGASIDVVIRFRPTAIGFASGTITIFSNDLFSPETVAVNGTAGAPRLVLGIANKGNFGNVCIGSFADEPLVVNNGGKCLLQINNITSSSAEFLVPEILSFPIAVAAGTSVSLPIRFQPTVLGPTPAGAQITVDSNDPSGPRSIRVSGNAPAGKLAVTGSTFFGGVPACCREERTISICNVGDCKLHVSSVHFKRKNRHWKLINNPFPATLHPGSCLAVVIRYKATEKFPHSCDLVIDSDDPTTPVKTLEVLASTIWSDCGCKKCCDDCRKGCCEKRHCDPCRCEKCRGDDDDEDEDEEKKREDEDEDD
ncbi:MAG TPA: choice-of-anchor D domain-containing protein, partial [Stellaceae bacterium]|nr:choice-of-anchor D domain-containing protein [Stellaceae bacterium]